MTIMVGTPKYAVAAGGENSDSDENSDESVDCDEDRCERVCSATAKLPPTQGRVPQSECEEGQEEKRLQMMRAIDKGDICAVEQLLDKGMSVDAMNMFGWTALMCAVNVANYQVTKLLLDRGANINFCTDQFSVLMACCIAAHNEDRIASCVELLLSRDADPNMVNGGQMTCLMIAARDGRNIIVSLLASHGAKLDLQDLRGYTALAMAAQFGRADTVLQLLKLGADKTIKTNDGKSPADLAVICKHSQVAMILEPSLQTLPTPTCMEPLSKHVTFSEHPSSIESVVELDDLGLFLHGLDLGHLVDIMKERGITSIYPLTMERDDLEKIGVTDPDDQLKLKIAIEEMLMDSVDLDTINLATTDGSEDLHNLLMTMKKQCCYMTETTQDIISRFPRRASQNVFSFDQRKEAQGLCTQLELQVIDLHKEVTCLLKLIAQMDKATGCCHIPHPGYRSNRKRRCLPAVALSVLGAGVLLLIYKASANKL